MGRAIRFFVLFGILGLGLFSILASGGGGGGGGSTSTTDPQMVFPLYDPFMAPDGHIPGFQATANMSGTITVNGQTYNATGTFRAQTLNPIFLPAFGLNALPVETLITISSADLNLNISSFSTSYFNNDTGNYERVFLESDSGITATPIEIHLLPDSGVVGDFGQYTSMLYSDGSTLTASWSLESSSAGFINLVNDGTLRGAQSNIILTQRMIYKINENGRTVYLRVIQDLVEDNISIRLSGSVTY